MTVFLAGEQDTTVGFVRDDFLLSVNRVAKRSGATADAATSETISSRRRRPGVSSSMAVERARC